MISRNNILKTLSKSLSSNNRNIYNGLNKNKNLFIRSYSSQGNSEPDYTDDQSFDLSYTIDEKEYPNMYYSQKYGLGEFEEKKIDYDALLNEIEGKPAQEGEEAKEVKQQEEEEEEDIKLEHREIEDGDIQSLLIELEEMIMDYQPPLFPYIKYEIYDLHIGDPEFWTIERLSKAFKIHPGRIVAIIRFMEIEKMERAAGTFDEEMATVIDEYGYEVGYRMDDEGYDMGEDEHQKQTYNNSEPTFSSAYSLNGTTLNRAYRNNLDTSSSSSTKKNSNAKPDPIHEIPTKIPASYPDKPIYFRGPTFVVPRKKNVVFVDTSRHPITKKVNPDPMVLIQGIDGSLRTPSHTEKSSIMQKVRPQKVKRDYQSVLNSPIKYKFTPKIKQTQKPVTEDKIEETQ